MIVHAFMVTHDVFRVLKLHSACPYITKCTRVHAISYAYSMPKLREFT